MIYELLEGTEETKKGRKALRLYRELRDAATCQLKVLCLLGTAGTAAVSLLGLAIYYQVNDNGIAALAWVGFVLLAACGGGLAAFNYLVSDSNNVEERRARRRLLKVLPKRTSGEQLDVAVRDALRPLPTNWIDASKPSMMKGLYDNIRLAKAASNAALGAGQEAGLIDNGGDEEGEEADEEAGDDDRETAV